MIDKKTVFLRTKSGKNTVFLAFFNLFTVLNGQYFENNTRHLTWITDVKMRFVPLLKNKLFFNN